MSWIGRLADNVISDLAPQWGLRRLAARRRREMADEVFEHVRRVQRRRREYAVGGFESAEQSRDAASWLRSRLSPDSALENDRPEMLQRADSSYKNYELATELVEGRVVRVAGTGMTVDPSIHPSDELPVTKAQADRWNLILRRNWERWSQTGGRRQQGMWQVQHLMQRYWERRREWFLLIGDQFRPLQPTTLVVQCVHPDRVSTPFGQEGNPLVRMGVQKNEDGEVIGYHVRDSHPGDDKEVEQTWTYYDRWFPNGLPQVLHEYEENDDGQHRGYPRYQVGTKRLKNSEEYDEADLERNIIAACQAAFVRNDEGPGDEQSGIVTDSQGNRVKEMMPGQIHYLGPSDSVDFSDPSGPQGAFAPYMEHQGRMFSAGAGVGYELLSGDWRALSYSAGKIIWNREEGVIDVQQKFHGRSVLWVYRHFVTRMILEGLIDIPLVAYWSNPWPFWNARLIPPRRPSIDPARENRDWLVNAESRIIPISDVVERQTGQPAREVYQRIADDLAEREGFGFERPLPNMGRDGSGAANPSTQLGDTNQQSSDANEQRQVAGDVEEN